MGLLEDAKARADANGDGKLTADDLKALGEQFKNNDTLKQLQAKADANNDGKVDLSDAKDLLGNIGNLFKKK